MKLIVAKVSLLFCLQFFAGGYAFSQSTSPGDYFRSKISGNWNTINSWESSVNGSSNWISATLIPTEAANVVTIRSGHTIIINTSVTTDQLIVSNGGILDLATGAGAALTINDGIGSDIAVQSGGIFKHNIGSTSSLPVFIGPATLEIQGGGMLDVATNNGTPVNYAITTSPIANNVTWADNAIFNWNTTGTLLTGVSYFPAASAIPIFRVSTAASIGGTNATVINGIVEANANLNLQSTGTKTLRNGIVGPAIVAATAVSVGQIIISGVTAKLGGGTLVVPDAGLMVAAGTEVTLLSNKTINKVGSANSPVNMAGVLAAGDFTIDGTSTIQINGTVKTSNANGLTGGANTTFAGNFSINYFGAYSVIEYNRVGDQNITPLNYANVNISGSGQKKVVGTADIGIVGVLEVNSPNTLLLNGINHLVLSNSSTMNINTGATFDNSSESRIKGGSYINIYGTFISRSAAGFTGATLATIQGVTTSTSVVIYDGSIVEFGRAGDQPVVSRNDYYNMTFSGSGVKTLPTTVPYGTVIIKENAIVDASNKTFGNENTNLTMTGGKFKIAGQSTKPDIAGTYTLTGGTIEFAGGTASSRQNIRSSPIYHSIEITGINVGNSNSSTKLSSGGSFTIKNGGSYENSSDKIDGTTGIQTFIMEAGSTFKTGVTGGFSGGATSALLGIENITIDPKSTIIYSRINDQTITPLSNYPTLLLKGAGIKTLSNGYTEVAATADSIVIDAGVFLKISQGAKLNVNARPFIIHSSSSATGGILEISDGAMGLLNASNVTVERLIPGKRAFRFLTSPVHTTGSIKANWMEGQNNPAPAYSINNNSTIGYGTHITGSPEPANGFDVTATNNPSLFSYNNNNQMWEPQPNTNNTMVAGYPYRLLVRGNRGIDLSNNAALPTSTILRTTGNLQLGTVTYDNNSTPSINGITGKYSFVGNPYACPVNWDNLVKPGLSAYYYVWDPTLNTRGAYATYGNNITTPSNSLIDQNIQPGQAFFVRTTAANPSLTFNENNKTSVHKSVYRGALSNPILSVQLLFDTIGTTDQTADGFSVIFNDDFSRDFGDEDAVKLINLDENMAIESCRSFFSIEGRPPLTSMDSVQIHLSQLRQKNYYLKILPMGFTDNLEVVMKDNFLKTRLSIELNKEIIVPFEISNDPASSSPNRFIINFKPTWVLTTNIVELRASKKDSKVELFWRVNSTNTIEKFEVERSVDGRAFHKQATLSSNEQKDALNNYNWIDYDNNHQNSYYRIRYYLKSGEIKLTNQVFVKMAAINPFTIFPNPIINNLFYITINVKEKGNYSVLLYNNSGQKIYLGSIQHPGKSQPIQCTYKQRYLKEFIQCK